MNTDFVDYTKGIVESIGLSVDSESYVTIESGSRITINELNVVLPTDEYIKNNVFINDKNKLEKKFLIFNPFVDDELKINDVLRVMSTYMSARSSFAINAIFEQLFILLVDESSQSKVHTTLQKWIVSIRNELGNKVKLVDTKTHSSFNKLVSHQILNKEFLIKYLICKGEAIAGVKYSRVAKLDPKVYDEFEETCKDLGVREKDVKLFKLMIDFIIPSIKDNVVGSKDTDYPSFMSLYELYSDIQTRTNFLLSELKEVLLSSYEVMYTPTVDVKDVKKFKGKITLLPNNNVSVSATNIVKQAPVTTVNPLLSTQQQLNLVNNERPTTLVGSNTPLGGTDLLLSKTRGMSNQSGLVNSGGSRLIMDNSRPTSLSQIGFNNTQQQRPVVQQQSLVGRSIGGLSGNSW